MHTRCESRTGTATGVRKGEALDREEKPDRMRRSTDVQTAQQSLARPLLGMTNGRSEVRADSVNDDSPLRVLHFQPGASRACLPEILPSRHAWHAGRQSLRLRGTA